MDRKILHGPLKFTNFDFITIMSLICFALVSAYFLALTVFPLSIDKSIVLGFSLSQEQSFNYPLFMHLSISIVFVVLSYMLSKILGVRLSRGNSFLAFLFMVNLTCFSIGINSPLLLTTKLWLFKDHLTLIQVLENLKLNREMLLYYIMLIFTFTIPILKMIAMAYDIFISNSQGQKNVLLSILSKWAMLDVLIIGVMVGTMKSGSGFAEMKTGTGLNYFIASILLSLIISSCLPFTKNYN